HYFHLGIVRNVQLPVRGVHDQIIPATLARERNAAGDLVLLCVERNGDSEYKKRHADTKAKHVCSPPDCAICLRSFGDDDITGTNRSLAVIYDDIATQPIKSLDEMSNSSNRIASRRAINIED